MKRRRAPACRCRSRRSTIPCTSSRKPGLLREVAVDGSKTYFDTNLSEHHHFFVEGEEKLVDIPGRVSVGDLPQAPEGMEISRVDVIVRIKPHRP